ncbi:MAG: phosphoribosylaminoimidazolesuccinocarboxamide synthase, partial [Firmicutes bacterium]|nr:phosphoribosylaminoimidazolesuccinocarboxamide synthase [Bacillota bacterium]
MKKTTMLYEGKAKKVWATDDETIVVVEFKDDATAGDGEKRGTIDQKGIVNTKISAKLFQLLEEQGIPTHFHSQLSERELAVKHLQMIP